jgi:hypothetical protein
LIKFLIRVLAEKVNGQNPYIYDDLNRLLTATNATYNQTFTYDIANNITYNSAVGTYTYPLASQPHPHAPLTAGSKAWPSAPALRLRCGRSSLRNVHWTFRSAKGGPLLTLQRQRRHHL